MKPFLNLQGFSKLGKDSKILYRFVEFGTEKVMDDQLKQKSKTQGPRGSMKF